MLTVKIELKLQELTTVDYDHHNWSWLLNPNMTHVPPVLPKAPVSVESPPAVVIERSRVLG